MTIRNTSQIIEQMRQVLKNESSELASFPDYGNLYAIFRSVATLVNEQDAKLEVLDNSFFIDTATGDSLDRKASEFGLTRLLGNSATGTVLASSLETSVTIPINTILIHPNTNLQYVITERITVRAGSKSLIALKSLLQSEITNLPAGEQLKSSLFSGVQFIIASSYSPLQSSYQGNLSGGSNKESDVLLKQRIKESLNSLSESTVAAIKNATINSRGITKVYVSENDPALGFIKVYINNRSQSISTLLHSTLDRIKPIGTSIIIANFELLSLDVNANITLYNTNELLDLTTELRNKLNIYVENIKAGETVAVESIAATILNNSRVRNVEILTPSSGFVVRANQSVSLREFKINYK